MELIAFVIGLLIFVLFLAWLLVSAFGKIDDFFAGWEEEEPPATTADPVLENPPNTELARKVWAAHAANQHLDLALLTGSPAEIRDAEAKATVANSHLVAFLTEKAES